MAWLRSVFPLAGKLGVKMRIPPVQPRSRLAHETAAWARKQGKFDEMNDAIFRAFFERGQDIGKVDILAGLAHSLGLDSDGLRTALQDHEYLQAVLDDESIARQYGLTGVPAYIYGDRGITGTATERSLEQFLDSCV
jgi:predicted DsbA family dithiol-disulfide isomerase